MTIRLLSQLSLFAIVGVLLGCKKTTPIDEMEKTAAALANAKQSPVPAVTPEAGAPTIVPAEQVRQAIDEYKAGKMEDAVTRLHLLRSTPVLSPEQRMALQDSMAAVMTEIYAKAEKGDPEAIAAVKQYEKMQTAGR